MREIIAKVAKEIYHNLVIGDMEKVKIGMELLTKLIDYDITQ